MVTLHKGGAYYLGGDRFIYADAADRDAALGAAGLQLTQEEA